MHVYDALVNSYDHKGLVTGGKRQDETSVGGKNNLFANYVIYCLFHARNSRSHHTIRILLPKLLKS
ncbi:protein of unknown function [Serratia sp. Tan611]|nr:protein of unknown function [Serratia sp. Tan611]